MILKNAANKAAKRLLAIEDDKDLLDTYEFLFEEAGYEVSLSLTGEAIFEQIITIKPDIILLDVRLGNLDGSEICRRIKNNPETKPIPVILVSGEKDPCLIKNYSEADDFIAKPFDIDHLLNRVGKLLFV